MSATGARWAAGHRATPGGGTFVLSAHEPTDRTAVGLPVHSGPPPPMCQCIAALGTTPHLGDKLVIPPTAAGAAVTTVANLFFAY